MDDRRGQKRDNHLFDALLVRPLLTGRRIDVSGRSMSVFPENQSDAEATAVLRHAAVPCVNSPQTAHNAAYGNFAPLRTPGEGDSERAYC